MDVTAGTALQVQIDALIDGWQQEQANRSRLAALTGSAREQGYADALDRCVQALKMLRDG